MGNIKVIIVTDYLLLGEGIGRILDNVEHIDVVGKSVSVTGAIEAAKGLAPDVIIADSAVLETESRRLKGYIKDNHMSSKILLLTERCDENILLQGLSMGVYGCLPRWTSTSDLIKAIWKVDAGEMWVGRGVLSKLLKSKHYSPWTEAKKLSCREEEIVALIVKGESNKEIAKKLFISEKTVKCHITNIFKKMEVNSRLKLALQIHPK